MLKDNIGKAQMWTNEILALRELLSIELTSWWSGLDIDWDIEFSADLLQDLKCQEFPRSFQRQLDQSSSFPEEIPTVSD